jgi:hypothetical protein
MAARKPQRAARKAPAAKKPIAKKPAKKKAAAKKPSAKPVAKKAVAKKPIAKKPVAKKPVAKKAVAKKAVAKKPTAKKAVAKKKKPTAPASTAARDALSARAQKLAITETLSPPADGTAVVEAYLRDVDHPFKAEMEAVRQIILGASPKIAERIKWNAPSFFYKEDLGAFNPRATEYAHLILLFPDGAGMQDDGKLLEGQHKDRREVRFRGMDEVQAKKPALEKLVKRWVALRDR